MTKKLTTIVDPKALGELLASTHLPLADKEFILQALPYMTPQAIEGLYKNLTYYKKQETEIIQKAEQINRKYTLLAKQEARKFEEEFNKQQA